MAIEEFEEISEERKMQLRFQDEVGTFLLGEAKWSFEAGELENVEAAKKSFYEALENFMHSRYVPSEKINDRTLGKFLEYRKADWKNKEILKELIDYFKTIAY